MTANRTTKIIAGNLIERVPSRRTWILILSTNGAFHMPSSPSTQPAGAGGEADAQHRLAGTGVDGYRAAVAFCDDALSDVEAEADAFAHGLGGEEGFEGACR